MKYYLIAGEASGDLHGSFLMRSLKKADPEAQFRYYGGDKMQAEGGELASDYREGAIMGFVSVLLHLPTIMRRMRACKDDIAQWKPDLVILIDYPGFNLQIAKFVKENSICPIYYYIPPKIWAWKEHRVKYIKRYVDRVFCIFPFEVDFYAKHGYTAEYVGNPSVDSVSHAQPVNRADFLRRNQLPDKPIIAILPGSRKQEVQSGLPIFRQINRSLFEGYQFVVGASNAVDKALYDNAGFDLVWDDAYGLLQHADMAIVNSGTATLETALFNVPQVVCYQLPAKYISYPIIYGMLLKIKYVSLVNIIAGKETVKELLAYHFTAENVQTELLQILKCDAHRQTILDDYQRIREKLTTQVASETAALKIIESLKH
ncbi:MAG: lipid-A-disaccharide synthase [Paludibacteraceae bacterium]|nr:lipid-A-disaccharide synthase [Paludibacteraceae bacterium]